MAGKGRNELACKNYADHFQFFEHGSHDLRILTSGALTGIAVGIWTLELVMAAGMATGMVWPLGSCKSTGKVPDTGLQQETKDITVRPRPPKKKTVHD